MQRRKQDWRKNNGGARESKGEISTAPNATKCCRDLWLNHKNEIIMFHFRICSCMLCMCSFLVKRLASCRGLTFLIASDAAPQNLNSLRSPGRICLYALRGCVCGCFWMFFERVASIAISSPVRAQRFIDVGSGATCLLVLEEVRRSIIDTNSCPNLTWPQCPNCSKCGHTWTPNHLWIISSDSKLNWTLCLRVAIHMQSGFEHVAN